MNDERICIVNPNHHYRYCPRCQKYAYMPTWKREFCSEECKEIFLTINKYGCGHLTADEARLILSQYDLSDKDNFKSEIRDTINALFSEEDAEEKPNKKKAKKPIVNELE